MYIINVYSSETNITTKYNLNQKHLNTLYSNTLPRKYTTDDDNNTTLLPPNSNNGNITLPPPNTSNKNITISNIRNEKTQNHKTPRNYHLDHSNTTIRNLSNKFKLKKSDRKLLNKGLTFIPTPSNNNIHREIKTALQNLFNKMSTIYYFRNNIRHEKTLHRKNNWKPPKPDNKNLLNYFTKTEHDIINFIKTTDFPNIGTNLDEKETNALRMLCENNKNIVIKKADKGGAIVIMDEKDYTNKVEKHLKDKISYEKVNNNGSILKDLKTNITSFLETILYHYHINENTFKYLLPPEKPRTNLFYIYQKYINQKFQEDQLSHQ